MAAALDSLTQAILYDGNRTYAAIGGTVTYLQDSTTLEIDANFAFSLESISPAGAISAHP